MTNISQKDRKKKLKEIREAEKRSARQQFPLSDSDLQSMFDSIDRDLGHQICDHTLKHTRHYLHERSLPEEAVLVWLRMNGGFCDCEVIANVEEIWLAAKK